MRTTSPAAAKANTAPAHTQDPTRATTADNTDGPTGKFWSITVDLVRPEGANKMSSLYRDSLLCSPNTIGLICILGGEERSVPSGHSGHVEMLIHRVRNVRLPSARTHSDTRSDPVLLPTQTKTISTNHLKSYKHRRVHLFCINRVLLDCHCVTPLTRVSTAGVQHPGGYKHAPSDTFNTAAVKTPTKETQFTW